MQRALNKSTTSLTQSMERLASGLKINSAKDDAAGLQISNRLTSQINGYSVAIRNANDGISMAQTAEGALGGITNNLFRLRDLSIQAGNGALSDENKKALQSEADQLLAEITRVNDVTQFGGQKVFESGTSVESEEDKAVREIIQTLQSGVLGESEEIIQDRFGLIGDGSSLKIDLEKVDGTNGVLASVSYIAANGSNQVMTFDIDDFKNPSASTIDKLKGTVLHEMVHAVMANQMDLGSAPTWFAEGTAEVIRGADDRLAADLANPAIGVANLKTDLNAIFTNNSAPTTTDREVAAVYSGGYVVMRYLEDKIGEGGIKTLMSELSNGESFDDALSTASGGTYANNAALQTELMAGTVFEDFITNNMDLTNADNGALGGLDASGGPSRTSTITGSSTNTYPTGFNVTVVTGDNDDDGATPDFAPNVNYGAAGFNEVALADYKAGIAPQSGQSYSFQVGADSNQTIDITMKSFSSKALGLDDLDLVENPNSAILAIDAAMEFVDGERAGLGASMNRLGYSINNMANISQNLIDSRARIQDTDFAAESAQMAKSQIMQQATSAMLTQANQLPQVVLQLLG